MKLDMIALEKAEIAGDEACAGFDRPCPPTAAYEDAIKTYLSEVSEDCTQTSDKWREAFARSANLAVDNWERDVSPKVAGGRMDKIINMLMERATDNEVALKQALTRNLALRKALECIARHDGLTLLCPDESASSEYQTAYSEGVSRGYRGLAEIARDALTANPFPGGETEAARPCTCHPDDNPPRPCPRKYALGECRLAAARRSK